MPTYTFTGAVAYDRLGTSWRTAAGLRSVSVTDPATGLTPANLKVGGVAVTWLTADTNSRYSFTCDVPGVVVDFGSGAEALYANEVPGLAVASSAPSNVQIDARMKWAPTIAYALGQQVLSPNSDVVKANVAHTSAAAYATDVAKWTLSTTFGRRGAVGLLASDHGVIGDGTTDDTTAMQALLTSAAALGVPVVLTPLSVVRVDTLTVPSNTVLNLNGGTLKKTATTGSVMLSLTGVTNVLIKDGTLDGDKASYAPVTEWRHGISILGSSSITIRCVTSKLHKGDGIYVGINGAVECQGIVLDRVICDANHRQGMSVIAVNGLVATACWFTNTAGTSPQTGVDVEPNTTTTVCKSMRFLGCVFSGNAGNGFLVSLVPARSTTQGQITLVACTTDSNTLAGVRVVESEDFGMVGGSASNNGVCGVLHDQNMAKNIKVVGVTFKGNGGHGVSATTNYVNWLVDGCTFDSNGTVTVGDGLNFTPSATSTNLRLIGNYSGGASQRYGLTLGANAAGTVMCLGNEYLANGTGARNVSTVITMDMDIAGAAAAIATPTSDTVGTKVAIDAIRVALKAHGIIL